MAMPVLLAGFLHALFAQSPEEKLLDQLIDKRKVADAADALPERGKASKSRLYGPADANRAAAQDAAILSTTLVSEELYAIRYLSLANVPAEQRKVYFNRLSFLLNSLSREPDITIPAQIGPDGIVVRVNLRDYGIDPKQWDRMGNTEPYFHEWVVASLVRVRTQTRVNPIIRVWPGGIVPDGTYWPPGTKYYDDETVIEQSQQKVKTEAKLGIASWLDPKDSAFLVDKLQTNTPVVRGDWFIANASLPPFYYDLLGLKTLDDAKELALFDKRTDKFDVKATVVFSGKLAKKVARNNRILLRKKTALGAWWETFDFKTSIDAQNVINNFLGNKRDGGEIIFSLPNGLQGYFLVNDKDVRVDEVPIDIAVDYLAQDVRVRCGRSCIWCHTQGIQPFKSDFKLQMADKAITDLGLNVNSDIKQTADLARTIRKAFESPDFDLIVKADNVRYGNAVRASARSSAPANAALFLELYDEYAELPIDAERLVYEAGASDFDVQAAVKVKVDGVNNGVLLRRLLNLPIRRDHFEEHSGEFYRRVAAWQAIRRSTIKANP